MKSLQSDHLTAAKPHRLPLDVISRQTREYLQQVQAIIYKNKYGRRGGLKKNRKVLIIIVFRTNLIRDDRS